MNRDEALQRAKLLPTDAKARLRWNLQRRPTQTPPAGDWLVWLILAGRGFGKTRTGAEWIAEQAWRHPGTRWAIIAPTYADARDTCIEGDSGLLHALGGEARTWNRSLGELELTNGSKVKLFSADEPERLRGPQHHGAWCDELAAWRYPEAWDQLQFGLRLVAPGLEPRTVVTTTPKPTALVRQLVDRPTTHVTRGSTFENAANLAPAALEELRNLYEGTRIGRQELYAELLLDTPGALWTLGQFDAEGFRVRSVGRAPDRVVVAIDPAVTSGENADETGLIAAGRYDDHCPQCGVVDTPHFVVLEDRTGRYSPEESMRVAVDLYDQWEGDRVVAEVNNGGDYIGRMLASVDDGVPFSAVHATRGKVVRAELASMLYEQGRVHHLWPEGVEHNPLELLEVGDTNRPGMVSWTPDHPQSPDRIDALVWAIRDLRDDEAKRRRRRGIVASGVAA